MKQRRRGLWSLALCAVLCMALLLSACSRRAEAQREDPVPKNSFLAEEFEEENGRIRYLGLRRALFGVDVSAHQGQIDWAAARQDGVEFAMLRIGYRGYTSGAVHLDERFWENLQGARDNGILVGVYFFSQALDEAEAREEADFLLQELAGQALELPIVFDWERVDAGRSANMDSGTLNACALAFCGAITAGGYQPAIYFNQEFGYRMFRLASFLDYPFWLAEYDPYPSFAYDFSFWQYSNAGQVAGIDTVVDLNLYFPPENADSEN